MNMNSRPLSERGLHRPRHPSLDNLRRSQQQSSRSYPQLPTERGGSSTNGYEVTFADVKDSRSSTSSSTTTASSLSSSSSSTTAGASMFGVRTPLDSILDFVAGVAMIVSVAGVVTILVILYITVRPFSKAFYRRLAAHMGAASFLDASALLLPNTRLFLTGDSDVPSPVGTSVLVCNHLMDGDWWAILMLGRCVGLRGSIKVFLRNKILNLHNKQRKFNNNGYSSSSNGNGSSDVARADSVSSSHTTVSFSRQTNSIERNGNGGSSGSCCVGSTPRTASPFISFLGTLLHRLMEFPVLSGENNRDYISDREELFELLRSFAENNGSPAPVHLLLFPEGWFLHESSSRSRDRKSILAKSNEFAKREGRPQLKHLLLPRTTGFNASLESLRESSPVVYDVTMAYRGYCGQVQNSSDLSVPMLWSMLRHKIPTEIHIRIKKYSMEEVLQDASWLDKQWAEKDRLLSHFSRHQQFPADGRGFCRHREFGTRETAMESSVVSLLRLLVIPCTVPVLILLSIPLFWVVFWLWMFYKSYKIIFPDCDGRSMAGDRASRAGQTPGSAGGLPSTGTPFFPATPFASPSVTNWRDVIGNSRDYDTGESPARR